MMANLFNTKHQTPNTKHQFLLTNGTVIINHQGEVRGISYIILQSIRSLLLYIIIVTTISLTSGSMIIAILISPNCTMRSQLNIYPSSCINELVITFSMRISRIIATRLIITFFSFAPESYNLNKLRLNGTKN